MKNKTTQIAAVLVLALGLMSFSAIERNSGKN